MKINNEIPWGIDIGILAGIPNKRQEEIPEEIPGKNLGRILVEYHSFQNNSWKNSEKKNLGEFLEEISGENPENL